MFARLGPWCHDNRWKVLIGWIVLLIVGNGVASSIGEAYRQDFSLDGFESTEGFNLVEDQFADGSGSPQQGQIVFQSCEPAAKRCGLGIWDGTASRPLVSAAEDGYVLDLPIVSSTTEVPLFWAVHVTPPSAVL